jgi:hypothetical protein
MNTCEHRKNGRTIRPRVTDLHDRVICATQRDRQSQPIADDLRLGRKPGGTCAELLLMVNRAAEIIPASESTNFIDAGLDIAMLGTHVWRYLTTNPRALYLLFNKSRPSVTNRRRG